MDDNGGAHTHPQGLSGGAAGYGLILRLRKRTLTTSLNPLCLQISITGECCGISPRTQVQSAFLSPWSLSYSSRFRMFAPVLVKHGGPSLGDEFQCFISVHACPPSTQRSQEQI